MIYPQITIICLTGLGKINKRDKSKKTAVQNPSLFIVSDFLLPSKHIFFYVCLSCAQEKAKKNKKFKPYRGKLKSAGVSKMTESLDDTEMKMYMTEMAASMSQQEISSNILTMPASCQSILKVSSLFVCALELPVWSLGRITGSLDLLTLSPRVSSLSFLRISECIQESYLLCQV